jgi:glycine oxidase
MANPHSAGECIIVGGGVVGLSIAFELARRGRQVSVLDQGEVGRGASWAGAGILPPSPRAGAHDPLDQLRGLSHQLHSEWAAELKQRTGIDTGYRRCGGLYLARSAAEAATLAAQKDWWKEHQIQAERCTLEETVIREPALKILVESGQVHAAWYLEDECQLRNPRHLKALVAACQQLGVEFHEQTEVIEIHSQAGNLRAVSVNGQYEARQVCVCSGAWAKKLLDSISVPTGIMPVRGQMLLYRAEEKLLRHVVNEGHRYLVARDDGLLLAGSCEEEAGYEIVTTPKMISQLRDWAEGILPQLRECSLERTWAGLRPGSYDGMPYIGPVGSMENLFVAAGHFRAGLHLSCATAVAVADLMEGKQPAIDMNGFRVGRG